MFGVGSRVENAELHIFLGVVRRVDNRLHYYVGRSVLSQNVLRF